jgi:hypothetical protein
VRPMYSLGQSTLAPVPKGVTFFWMKPSISWVRTSDSLDRTSLRVIVIENIYKYILCIKA